MHTDFSFSCYVLVIFNSTVPPIKSDVLHYELCDIITTRQCDSNVPVFIHMDCIGKVEMATRKYILS